MNALVFGKKNPRVQRMRGTTRNEALHNQLKGFWRNVMHQTARNAKVICSVATLAKLCAGQLQ
eukprot:8697936-Karenia_brevis.AAC.1